MFSSIMIWEPSEALNATADDMRNLWWGYCGNWAVEEMRCFPVRYMAGISSDGT